MLHRCRELVGVLELAAVVAVHAVGEAEPALDLTLREVALDDLHADLVELLVSLVLLLHVLRDALAFDGITIVPVRHVDGSILEGLDFLGSFGQLEGDVVVYASYYAFKDGSVKPVASDAILPSFVDSNF